MNSSVLACILSCIVVLSLVSSAQGGCLADSDTAHTAADYAQRIWNHASKNPRQPSTDNELKFFTFNLQSGYHANCNNNPTAQAQLMADSDYMASQETVQNVDTRCSRCYIPAIIADTAGMSTRFGMAMPYRTGQYGVAVGSTQTILDTKYILMSYPNVEPRVAVAIKTQPLALQGRYLWYITVHIEYYVPAARYSQIAQILEFVSNQIADPTAVVMMAGDFNGGPWDAVYGTMQNAGFKNAWEMYAGSIQGGNTIPVDWPGSRFDHIWYRAPADVSVTVKSAEVPVVYMSDHRPFTATLAFNVAGSATAPPPVLATTRPTAAATPRPTSAPTAAATARPTSAPTNTPALNAVICVGPILEGQIVNFTCPSANHVMTVVDFASYGTPTGSCGSFKLGTCIGGASTAVVSDKCLGRNKCSFQIANNVFGDPCPRTGKHFLAQVVCS